MRAEEYIALQRDRAHHVFLQQKQGVLSVAHQYEEEAREIHLGELVRKKEFVLLPRIIKK